MNLVSIDPRDPTPLYAQLDRAIRERRLGDEPLVRYLTRRAWRDEWLHAPAAALYPERRWSPID